MNSRSDLTGIIACGGASSRMGFNKGLLDYHGQEQQYFLFNLLQPYCEKVLLSCNSQQAPGIREGFPFLIDDEKFSGHGPVSGLLTAFENNKGHSILFVGCDYPFLNDGDINYLLRKRDKNTDATCYMNTEGMPEPLCAIYEERSLPLLLERFRQKRYSLREFLSSSKVNALDPLHVRALKSIDNPEEYEEAKKHLSRLSHSLH